MKRPACPAGLWRVLLVLVLLGMPALDTVSAGQKTEEIDIDVEIIPGTTNDGSNDVPGDASLLQPGSVMFGLYKVASVTSGPVTETTFELIVMDQRQTGFGWSVTMMQAPDAPVEPVVLSRYVRRTIVLDGQERDDIAGPRGYRMSLGQTLEQSTPIVGAGLGAGAGSYSILFAVKSTIPEPGSVIPLILNTSASP